MKLIIQERYDEIFNARTTLELVQPTKYNGSS